MSYFLFIYDIYITPYNNWWEKKWIKFNPQMPVCGTTPAKGMRGGPGAELLLLAFESSSVTSRLGSAGGRPAGDGACSWKIAMHHFRVVPSVTNGIPWGFLRITQEFPEVDFPNPFTMPLHVKRHSPEPGFQLDWR